MRSVAVVGLGLIGASLCRALRESRPDLRLVGVTRSASTAGRALADGVCDAAGTSPELLSDADITVLCTPVDAMEGWLRACAEHCPSAGAVTDCGSTKAWVVERGSALLGPDRFLGGHPMAGRERSGYEAAEGALFAGCTWVFTPSGERVPAVFEPWLAAVRDLGARVEVMGAAEHDRAVAWISHLPFALSAALLRSAAAAADWPAAARLAASGFRDMARLAGGDPAMYAAITATNRPAIEAALAALEAELAALRRVLAQPALAPRWFEEARDARAAWLARRAADGRPVR